MGVQIDTESRWLNAVSARIPAAYLDEVGALPFVSGIRPVARLTTSGTNLETDEADEQSGSSAPLFLSNLADPIYGAALTQLAVINAIETLEQGLDGSGVRLGFLDTRYNFDHPVFADLVREGRLREIRDFTDTTQSSYHGQYVSSVAVGHAPGQLVGACHGAEVWAATTEVVGYERNVEEDNFVAGLEWLESEGVDVVNVSLGYDVFDIGQRSYTREELNGDIAVTSRAVDAAVKLGVVVVAAAGNGGGCGPPSEFCSSWIGSPADADSVITAGGIRPDSTRYSSSSYGPSGDGQIKPDVVAQATSVAYARGTDSYAVNSAGVGIGSGTSFATPLTASVVCQMLQANPSLTPMQVREILHQTASQADEPDNSMGWGIINAAAAVAAAQAIGAGSEPPIDLVPGIASVYPQPADRFVTIELRAAVARAALGARLFDLTGRVVAAPIQQTGRGLRLDVSALPSSLYLLRFSADGAARSVRVLVRH